MDLIGRVYYFFTPYTDARERSAALFFKSLTEHSSQAQTRARLGYLLQRNIAVINLWTEYRYKGYRYLGKSERRKLYANLQLIAEDFDRFYASNARPAEAVVSHMQSLAPHTSIEPNKAVLLQALMDYFSPGRGVYQYRESSSFGRLLHDPSREKLTGDCNQIVTLYIYLYSRYLKVHDLQLRVLPGHVALHHSGVDIETTDSTYANYAATEGNVLLPVEEIVSINLLDTTDTYLSTHEVAAEDFLQASRLAFILSHDRGIVTRNLSAAYSRLINVLMERHNYTKALEFAEASGDTALLGVVGHNGAVYEMEHHNFAAARRFAEHATNRDALIRSSWQAEGGYRYQAHRYHDAIKAFGQVKDEENVRKCYEALYAEEQGRLGANLTTESIMQYAGTIKHMQTYAQKSGNKSLIEHAEKLHKLL